MIKYQCVIDANLDLTINIDGKQRVLDKVKKMVPVVLSMSEIIAFQRNFGKDTLTVLGAKEV